MKEKSLISFKKEVEENITSIVKGLVRNFYESYIASKIEDRWDQIKEDIEEVTEYDRKLSLGKVVSRETR